MPPQAAKGDAEMTTRFDDILPELEGSDKQVAWAKDLRAKALPQLEQLQDLVDQNREAAPDMAAYCDKLIREEVRQPKAKYWIDTRNRGYDFEFLRSGYQQDGMDLHISCPHRTTLDTAE
jgi:hypothetical protein